MKNIQGLLILIVALIAGLYITVSVLTGGGNSISSLARYLVIGIAALGFFGKKFPFYVLAFTGAYSDLIKRLLIIEGNFTQIDIIYVLAISPLLMFTLFFNNFIRYAFNARSYGKVPLMALLYGVGFLLLSLAQSFQGGATLFKLLQVGANVASYAFLPFCLLVTFPSMEGFLRYLKVALLIFLPVPLHGLSQYFLGYNSIEYTYLASGMTSIANLFDIDKTRPFSTVASPGSFALTCGFFLGFALFLWAKKNSLRDEKGQLLHIWNAPSLIFFLVCLLFFAGLLASKSRTQMLIGLSAIPLAYLYRSKLQTFGSYLFILGLAITLFFSSSYILDKKLINRYQTEVVGQVGEATGIDSRYILLSTFTIRLEGFRNLLENPEYHTLFGSDAFSDLKTKEQRKAARSAGVAQHDMISAIALRFGLVALFSLFLMVILILWVVHRLVFSIPRGSYQSIFARFGLAMFFLSYAGAALAGGALLANPVPMIINLSSGLVFFGLRERRSLEVAREQSNAPEKSPVKLNSPIPV